MKTWRLAVNFSISQVQTAYYLECFSASKGGYNLKSGMAPPNINGRSYLSNTFAPATAALNAAIRAFFIINMSIWVFHYQFVLFWFFTINLYIFSFSFHKFVNFWLFILHLSIRAFFIINLFILDSARQLQFRANSHQSQIAPNLSNLKLTAKKASMPKKPRTQCQKISSLQMPKSPNL